ncbi:specific transcription factor domain protein [Aspergillus parasiticus SU-1]|uniref:Specific transcription factor domain protein n=1 Tax=Aspergillus parasiticus (strain ATCC 56775 / NRRL 5862 / SRRC 143 / SU-1) TaxID=1403190 RepID=A0A0F0IMZ9_ASPPU|nr:specific transcription factor domain protein [Aspergillus parasiticus SU-1]
MSELDHKPKTRTRNGCANCRQSRVKCDGKEPSCTRCWQKGWQCTREKLTLKWRSDYHSRGLAFGREGVWGKGTQSKKNSRAISTGEQNCHFNSTVYPWSFVNQDIPTLRWLYDEKRAPGQPSSMELSVIGPKRDRLGVPEQAPLWYSPPVFPYPQAQKHAIMVEYFIDQVCPRTTSSLKIASPFTSVILPFCLNGSVNGLLALQALAACYWSQSNPAHTSTAVRLKSQVLGRLRRRIAADPSYTISRDPEVLVLMMMLSLYDIVDQCDKGWIVHLQGAKDIIRLRRRNLSNETQCPVTAFAELFFAFQDVMGRTACAKADLFGPSFWDQTDRSVNPWMGCSPELVSILFSILDLSRIRPKMDTDLVQEVDFSMRASALNRRLSSLVQVLADPDDHALQAVADLKRLACTVYLHCALYNAEPSTPIVRSLVRRIIEKLSTLLQENLIINATWPIFVAAVELDPADGEDWQDPVTGELVCGRALVLRALATMAQSTVTSVARVRSIIETVWQSRDCDLAAGSSRRQSSQHNDWEWYVVPLSDALSLAQLRQSSVCPAGKGYSNPHGVSNLQQTHHIIKTAIVMTSPLRRPGLQSLYRVSIPQDLQRNLWFVIAGSFTLGILSWAIYDYRDWVGFGKRTEPVARRPPSAVGSKSTVSAFPATNRTPVPPTDPAPKSKWASITEAESARSRTLPQRQCPEPIEPQAREALFNLMNNFHSHYPHLLRLDLSKTEGGTADAIYARSELPTCNPEAVAVGYEIAHAHPADNSLHVLLSPADARTVIEAAWGQRFAVPSMVPPGWIMLYAPRNSEEVELVSQIVRAGIQWTTGAKLD